MSSANSTSWEKELAEVFKCNLEHARRICIKLSNEGKIELTKIVKRLGDLALNIGNNIPTSVGIS